MAKTLDRNRNTIVMRGVGGADGCKAGWLLLEMQDDAVVASLLPTAGDLFVQIDRLDVLAIDIPIGLSNDAPRACDIEARRLLGHPRASSVFPAPVRAALASNFYESACRASQQACGKRLSRQTFAILSRIRDVDVQLRLLPNPQERVREVHPEVSFYFWAGSQPMRCSKKTASGFQERFRLAESAFPGAFVAMRDQYQHGAVANDDILDALAALWTAKRVRDRTAVAFPQKPAADQYGLRMEIVA